MNISRLRNFRKAANLTQREVATLVGYASQRAYSDLELGLKRPALGTALACSILFKASLHELFPTLAEFTERDLAARSKKLHEEMRNDPNRTATASFVAEIVDRLDPPNPPP